MSRVPLVLALSLALAACQSPQSSEPKHVTALETEQQRISYMVGTDVARNLEPIKDEIDLAIVDQAIRDTLAGQPPLLDKAALEATRETFTTHLREKREAQQKALAAKNLSEGQAFLARNAKQPDIHTTASGLQYQVLTTGSGAKPAADATVRVNYIGKLLDGREFENTYAIDHAAEFPLTQLMPGWREGLTLMPVGSKYRLWIPAALAYGERGVPGAIGPNATLVFDVELLAIAGQGAP
ncbi:FKBP-type peptidyl-prolyl cis-trans isomerase [Lysobacter tyrosinilyticus]